MKSKHENFDYVVRISDPLCTSNIDRRCPQPYIATLGGLPTAWKLSAKLAGTDGHWTCFRVYYSAAKQPCTENLANNLLINVCDF